MIIEYIKPIESELGYAKTLLKAAKTLKDIKKSVITEAIVDVIPAMYSVESVKHLIDYKYDVRGNHTFLLEGKEMIHFSASTYKVNKKNEIVCNFEYKLLYKQGR